MAKDITADISETIFTIVRLLKRQMTFKSDFFQLSVLQIQALCFLKQKENAQMSEIAEYFRIELPSATSLLNKLHQMELVERQADPKDRRLVRINLTDQGKSLLKQVMDERSKKVAKMLSYLSGEDKKQLFRILRTLSVELEK